MAGGDYKRGEMDISQNQDTYALVWAIIKWSLIAIFLVLAILLIFRT